MISIKMIIIAIAAISALLSIYAIDMVSYSLAADSTPIVGGMCPDGHECTCTPDTGVFHDLTAQVNINMGCDGREGANGGQ